MARVPVFEPLGGPLVYIDEGDLAAATQQGFTQPTPQEVARAELGEKYGGVGSTTGAAVAGALRGATLGGSDILASGLGLGERLKAYQELEPGVSIGSEIAGALLPIAASALATAPAGGAGGAAVAGSLAARIAAQAPAALAMRAGERAVAGLGLAAAEGVAQGVGRTALRFGTQAAVEGALQGAGREAGQLALDNQLTGEHLGQIAAAGLTGGALGFGIGGAIGAGAGLLGKIGARGAATLEAEAASVDAPPGFFAKAQAKAQKISAKFRGANPADAEEFVAREAKRAVGVDAVQEQASLLGQAAPARTASSAEPLGVVIPDAPTIHDVARTADAVVESEQMAARMESAANPTDAAIEEIARLDARAGTGGRKIREELDDFLPAEELTDLAVRSMPLKTELLISGQVSQEALPAQRAWVEKTLFELDNVIKNIADDTDRFNQGPVKRLRALQNRVQKLYEAAIALPESEQSSALYRLVDRDLKSDMGSITKPLTSRSGTYEMRQTADALKEFYKIPQKGLESVEMFGPIASIQKELNPLITEALARKKAFKSDWYEEVLRRKNPIDPWHEGLPVSDPKKILGIIKDAVSPMGSTAEGTLVDYIGLKRNQYNLLLKYGDFSGQPKLLEAIKSQSKRLERILGEVEKLKNTQIDINFVNPAGTGVSRGIEAIPGVGAVKAVVSAALNPKLIAGAFRGAEAILSPAAARTVESVAETQSTAVGSGVARAMRSIAATAVDTTARAARVGVVAQYEDKSKRVRDLGEQVPAITARIERDTQWLQGAPTARGEAVATAVRQIDYLNAALPKGLKAPTPYAQDLPATRAQVQGWLVRLRTVENPASLLDDVASGKLSPEAVDAVKTVYPAMFADMQSRVVQKLAKLQAEGRAPNVATRTQLGLLLGIPTDPLLMPQSMRAIQSIYPPPASAGAPGAPLPIRRGPPPNIAKNFQSGSEGIALTSGLK